MNKAFRVLLLALVALLLVAGAAAQQQQQQQAAAASGDDGESTSEEASLDVSESESSEAAAGDDDTKEGSAAAAAQAQVQAEVQAQAEESAGGDDEDEDAPDSGDASEPSGEPDQSSGSEEASSEDGDESSGAEDPEPERLGIENFVLNMRLRTEADQKEAKAAWAVEAKALNASVLARAKVLGVAEARLAAGNTDYEKARILLADATRELNTLNSDIAQAAVNLEAARAARAEAKAHWDQKMALLESNRASSVDSVKIIERISKTLDAPRPSESISEILAERRDAEKEKLGDKASNSSSTAEVEMALEAARAAAAEGLQPEQVSQFRDLLKKLNDQLVDHLEKLNEDIVTSRDGARDHLNRQDAEIQELSDKKDQLRDNLKANTEALPPLHTRVNETYTALSPLTREAHAASEAHSYELAQYTYERDAFVRQQAMRDRRARLVTLLNQVVQEQLRSKNPRVVHRLHSIRDMLPVVSRNTTVTLPKVHFATDTRGLSALEMEADMCGNWKFDEEDGDGFAIDSSRHAQDGKLHGENLRRVNGSDGRALSFDGMNDYVDVGRVGDFGAEMNNFTVSVWVRTVDRHLGYASILKSIGDGLGTVMGVDVNRRVGRPNADGVWPTGVQSSSDLAFESGATLFFLRDSRGRVLAGHINTELYDGKWHHVQWTVFSAERNNMGVWVDGKHVPFVATVEEAPNRFRDFDANMFIGAADVRGTPMGFFDGDVDNVQLFCSGQRPVYGQKCCRICSAELTKACGNDCVPLNATCVRDAGCACSRVDLEQQSEQQAGGAEASASGSDAEESSSSEEAAAAASSSEEEASSTSEASAAGGAAQQQQAAASDSVVSEAQQEQAALQQQAAASSS